MNLNRLTAIIWGLNAIINLVCGNYAVGGFLLSISSLIFLLSDEKAEKI